MSSEQHPRRVLPTWWTLGRDVVSFLGGWTLTFLEVQRPEIRESVLVFAATVVGVPAGAVGVQAVTDALAARRSGTGGSSSQPPEPAASASQPQP